MINHYITLLIVYLLIFIMLQFTSSNIYHLKKEYGFPIDLYKKSVIEDIRTGRKIITLTKVAIQKGLLFPNLAAVIQASRNLLRSTDLYGYTDTSERTIGIDVNDIPPGFIITEEDCYVIISEWSPNLPARDHRYQIKGVSFYERAALILRLYETKGAELRKIVDNNMKDKLNLQQFVFN